MTADRAPRSVGLVLGGGGVPGIAFHAGTLLAIETDFGWDPRRSDVIVGTSAGSIVGALLRAGLSTDDLAAWATGVAPRDGRQHLRAPIERSHAVGLRLAAPWLRADRSARSLLQSTVDFGLLDNSRAMLEMGPLLDAWPDEPLLITATKPPATRVVFGREQRPRLAEAVAASCAIPMVFRPVRIDGQLYVDGGVASPTNADLLIDEQVDLAVILSPMSGGWFGGQVRPDWLLRSLARRALAREVRQLQAAGIDTVVFEPDRTTTRSAGWNYLTRRRAGDVVRESFLSATKHIDADPDRRATLERLRAAASSARP
jgi:NTE family protein